MRSQDCTTTQGDSSALRPGLGWLWFGGSTMLPSCTATSAKFQSAQAELGRQWNTQNPSQPNPGLRADESPCISGRNQLTSTKFTRPNTKISKSSPAAAAADSWDIREYVLQNRNLLELARTRSKLARMRGSVYSKPLYSWVKPV